MSGPSNDQSYTLRQFILDNVREHPKEITSITAERFGVSRQAVCGHLRKLIADEKLIFSGTTKDRSYSLKAKSWTKRYGIENLEEDLVWRQDISPLMKELPDNVRRIWQYGFTEMLNNAIDHSEGDTVSVLLENTAIGNDMFITDNGVGIFKKIQRDLRLEDERHSVLELAKGKLTTDSKRHSGEGIFFTSRVFDFFAIWSGDVRFCHTIDRPEDFILDNENTNENGEGTTVILRLRNDSKRTLNDIYDEYTTENDGGFGFDKTVVPVRLAQHGDEMLVSRSQAKRLLARFDRFRVVLLDFNGVQQIGQAFADEVFRVFKNDHPEITLLTDNVSEQVKKMIARTGYIEQ